MGSFCDASDRLTLETCGVDGDGCVYLLPPTTCPAQKPCTGTHPAASCSCPPAPAICSNTTGTFCDASNRVVICTRDEQKCLVATTTMVCSPTKPCMGPAGSASCKCADPPAACGAATSGNVCQSATAFVTCTTTPEGCVIVTGPPGSCSASKPAGRARRRECDCPAPPAQCQGAKAGNVCQSAIAFVTCGQSAEGCTIVNNDKGMCSTTKPCQGGPGAAGCACPPTPPPQCQGASAGTSASPTPRS